VHKEIFMSRFELNILLLEDNVSDAKLVKRELLKNMKDFYLEVTCHKAELEDLLNSREWDLVISDYSMPQMTGLDALELIRNHGLTVPFIMISGIMGEEIAVKVIKAGAEDYILKDKLHRLNPVIERVQDESKRRRLLEETQEELLGSHSISDAIIKDSPLGIVVRDSEMHLVKYNNSWQKIWDFSDEELNMQREQIDLNLEEYYDYAPDYQTKIREVYEKGNDLFIPELKLARTNKNRPAWISQHFYALKSKSGKVNLVVSITENISENKINENRDLLKIQIYEMLNKPGNWEEILKGILIEIQSVMGYSSLGIRLKDGDKYPYYVNIGFSKNFLTAENGLLGCIRHIRDNNGDKTLNCLCWCVIQKNYHDAASIFNEFGSFWTNDLKDLQNHPSEAIRQMLDNNKCLLDGYNSLALIPLRIEEGEYGLLQINDYEKDSFTESEIRFLEEIGQTLSLAIQRKQVEKELKDSELRFRSYLEYAPYGVFITDEKGHYKEVNPAACLITGYNGDELLSMSVTDLIPPEHLEVGLQPFKTLLETGYSYGEILYLHKSGEIRWWSVATVKISDTVFLGFCIDITESKEAEKKLLRTHSELQEMHWGLQQKVAKAVIELREKDHLIIEQSRQRAKSEMLSQIAHHWRQPLNSISAQIQSIGDAYEFDELDQEEMSKRMDKILITIADLSRSIDNFRNVYYGQKEIVEFDVNALLSEIIFLYRDRFSNSGIEFESNLGGVVLLHAVPSDYAQAVINILDNAYEILVNRKVKNPQVKLTFGCEDEQFVISIRDNGGGIDPSIRENMFELYVSSKENLNNTGIGLFFSKMIIVEQMGGKIEVLDHDDGVEFKLVNSMVKNN